MSKFDGLIIFPQQMPSIRVYPSLDRALLMQIYSYNFLRTLWV